MNRTPAYVVEAFSWLRRKTGAFTLPPSGFSA